MAVNGVSVDLFVSTLKAIGNCLRQRGLSDEVHGEDLEHLRAALARIETQARERASGAAEKSPDSEDSL